jgi:hypothetical protein
MPNRTQYVATISKETFQLYLQKNNKGSSVPKKIILKTIGIVLTRVQLNFLLGRVDYVGQLIIQIIMFLVWQQLLKHFIVVHNLSKAKKNKQKFYNKF